MLICPTEQGQPAADRNSPLSCQSPSDYAAAIDIRPIKKSEPDGYTIGLGGIATNVLAIGTYAKLPYDPREGFTFVGGMWQLPNILVAESALRRTRRHADADVADGDEGLPRQQRSAAAAGDESGGDPRAKALKGFGGRSVLEVVDDEDGDTCRAVYTVRFAGVIYVLHAFQKISRKGIETPKRDIDVIKARLKIAEAHYRENFGTGAKK